MKLEAEKINARVIWITGFSGSGKTTVGRKVVRVMKDRGEACVFLDGDDLRSIFGHKWSYTNADRMELAHVYFRLCHYLASSGMTVVISAVAMFEEIADWFRDYVENGLIVRLEVPFEILKDRDSKTKRVYETNSNPVLDYNTTFVPDLTIENYGGTTPDTAAAQVLALSSDRSRRYSSGTAKGRYWNDTYQANVGELAPSPFSEYVQSLLPAPARILEVGCGNGRDSRHFAAKGNYVHAIDTSVAAIDLCRKIHAGYPVTFDAGSADTLLERGAPSFEVIYSRFVLHAMTKVEETTFIRAARSLMRPGGLLAIECRSINDPLARSGEVIGPFERISGHYRRFILIDELVASLSSAQFEIVHKVESTGLAVFRSEDPVVIRIIARAA